MNNRLIKHNYDNYKDNGQILIKTAPPPQKKKKVEISKIMSVKMGVAMLTSNCLDQMCCQTNFSKSR